MPYVTGENPEACDLVSDRFGRTGTVTHVIMWGSICSELVIEWDDGTTGIRYAVHEDLELLSRRERQRLSFVSGRGIREPSITPDRIFELSRTVSERLARMSARD